MAVLGQDSPFGRRHGDGKPLEGSLTVCAAKVNDDSCRFDSRAEEEGHQSQFYMGNPGPAYGSGMRPVCKPRLRCCRPAVGQALIQGIGFHRVKSYHSA